MLVVMLMISVNLYGQEKFAVKNPEGCTFVYSILPYPEGDEFNSVLNHIPQSVCLEGIKDKIYEYSQMTIPGEVAWKGKIYKVQSIRDFAFDEITTVNLKNIIISEGIESLGRSSFTPMHYSLEQVVLPKSLKTISSAAFAECKKLKEVVIPKDAHLEEIKELAFWRCSQLTSFYIPENVANIGSGVWADCMMLTEINVANKNRHFASENGVLYTKDRRVLIQYPGGNTDDIFVVPWKVEEIAKSAFSDVKYLKKVCLPSSLKRIQTMAFYGCSELKEVYFPDGLKFIEETAFGDCENLKEVFINKHTKYMVYLSDDDFDNTFMPATKVNRVKKVPNYMDEYQRLSNVEMKSIINIHALLLKNMQQLFMDLSASVNQRKDNNGRPCALLRVMIPVSGCVFSGNVIGNTDFKVNEYWVYLSEHSRYLKIQIPGCESLMLDFKLLGFSDGVESLCTYELRFEME